MFVQHSTLLARVGVGGSTLGIFGWECAARTLEPFAYTRASSSEFCYPTLVRMNSPNPLCPRVAVFQKLLRSLAQSSRNKTDLIFAPDIFIFFIRPVSLVLTRIFNQLISFLENDTIL